MAINFTTSFTDLGKLFASFANVDGFGGAQANYVSSAWGSGGPVVKAQTTMYSDILTRLEGSGLTTTVLPKAQSLNALLGLDGTLNSVKQAIQSDAQALLIQRVNNDVAQLDPTSFNLAMQEWIRQMQSQSQTVKACTVSATTTNGGSNTGNATVYASLVDPNGLTLEYVYAESMILRCTQDANHGATAGSEQLSITSPAQVSSTTSYLWPAGSGLNASVTVVDPTQGNGSGQNLLTGGTSTTVGAFKAFTGAVPTNWTAITDPTNVADGTSTNYSGVAHCLKFIGNTAGTNLNTEIRQAFANGGITGGSSITLTPNTVYHFCIHVKADVVPAAGAITVSLVDGNGTVINNNKGTANSIVISISGLGNTNYNTFTGSFQTPTIMPANVSIAIKATTKITTGSNVFMDFVSLNQPQGSVGSPSTYGGLYAGGPYLSVFRGSTDLINWVSNSIGDTFTVAIANNYGSISPTVLSFQGMFWQLFNLPASGFILPSATGGAETQANSLIQ